MALLSPSPYLQFSDNNGVPLAGGTIATYQAGTLTPAATYTDYQGYIPNANPVVLDEGGRADIWLPSGAFKYVIQSADGTFLKTVDNISSSTSTLVVDTINNLLGSTSYLYNTAHTSFDQVLIGGYSTIGDGGGGKFNWIPTATGDDGGITILPSGQSSGVLGRWVRDFLGGVDPRWYGAVLSVALGGDPGVNDTPAFQSAKTAADALGTFIRLTPGNYHWASDPGLGNTPVYLEPLSLISFCGFTPTATVKVLQDQYDNSTHWNGQAPILNYNFNPGGVTQTVKQYIDTNTTTSVAAEQTRAMGAESGINYTIANLTSDNIANASGVTGTSVTQSLNALSIIVPPGIWNTVPVITGGDGLIMDVQPSAFSIVNQGTDTLARYTVFGKVLTLKATLFWTQIAGTDSRSVTLRFNGGTGGMYSALHPFFLGSSSNITPGIATNCFTDATFSVNMLCETEPDSAGQVIVRMPDSSKLSHYLFDGTLDHYEVNVLITYEIN